MGLRDTETSQKHVSKKMSDVDDDDDDDDDDDTTNDLIDFALYRTLHGASCNSATSCLLKQSFTPEHWSTVNNNVFTCQTFGLCQCLHAEKSLTGWDPHGPPWDTPEDCKLRDTAAWSLCTVCHKRTSTVQTKPRPPVRNIHKRSLTFSGRTARDDLSAPLFRHHDDVGRYVEEYRRTFCRFYAGGDADPQLKSVQCTTERGLVDSNIDRSTSHRDAIDNLIKTILCQRREMRQRLLTYALADPSRNVSYANNDGKQTRPTLTSTDTVNTSAETNKQTSKEVTITLKHGHESQGDEVQKSKSLLQEGEKDDVTLTKGSPVDNHPNKPLTLTETRQWLPRSFSPSLSIKSGSIPEEQQQLPSSALNKRRSRCKKFTSSSEYLELSAPKKSVLPLPVHLVFNTSSTSRQERQAPDLRIKSASSTRIVPRRPHLCRGSTSVSTMSARSINESHKTREKTPRQPNRPATTPDKPNKAYTSNINYVRPVIRHKTLASIYLKHVQ